MLSAIKYGIIYLSFQFFSKKNNYQFFTKLDPTIKICCPCKTNIQLARHSNEHTPSAKC